MTVFLRDSLLFFWLFCTAQTFLLSNLLPESQKHCNYTSPMLMARAISPSTSAARIMPSATLLSPPVCCFLLRDAVLRLCFVPVLRLRAEVFCRPAVLLALRVCWVSRGLLRAAAFPCCAFCGLLWRALRGLPSLHRLR